MTNLKMVFWYCVTTLSLLMLTAEASSLFYDIPDSVIDQVPADIYGLALSENSKKKDNGRNNNDNMNNDDINNSDDIDNDDIIPSPQLPTVTFTSHEYDGTTPKEPASSILNNDMRISRVVIKEATKINSDLLINKKIEDAFKNIFQHRPENGETTTCYFGEVFQKNEQYYNFRVTDVSNLEISIGYGYVLNYHFLKGRTAEFDPSEAAIILMSKNDKNGDIEVEIQSGNSKVVLTSPKDPQYRPVVCLKGEGIIQVKQFNGMKMASLPDGKHHIELPNSRKKLKPMMAETVGSYSEKTAKVDNRVKGPLALGLIQIHTLTSTFPPTHIFTGYFFDGRNWWMSPSLVDEKNNWMRGKRMPTVFSRIKSEGSLATIDVWQANHEGHSMTVHTSLTGWDKKIYALYDDDSRVVAKKSHESLPDEMSYNCSGPGTCGDENNECHWPRSDRENLRPGMCIEPVCKIIIEAQLQTGLYKPDGDRRIGDETALRLITPSDVGVEKKGIAMIKALLDRAEDFENIEPTGDYEFGGVIDPPNSANGSQKRYFNTGGRYYGSDEAACDNDSFVFIISIAGIKVGFGIKVDFFDYVRCTPNYGVVTNLITNALDKKKFYVDEAYGSSQYQRVDPNKAIDTHEDKIRTMMDPILALKQESTVNLYYNDPGDLGGNSDKPQFSSFYNRDRFSAWTELHLGLTSCFGECVKNYYINNNPVFHVTTFVRQRVTDEESTNQYYTEIHPLMWYYGLDYKGIDFELRDQKAFERDVGMTLYDENNIPSWFVNKNGADPDMVEGGYTSHPALHPEDNLL